MLTYTEICRGTRQYRIEISLDRVDWVLLFSDTMPQQTTSCTDVFYVKRVATYTRLSNAVQGLNMIALLQIRQVQGSQRVGQRMGLEISQLRIRHLKSE